MRDKVARGCVDAARALRAYRLRPGQDPDDFAAIGDLICDLLHLHRKLDADLDARAAARGCALNAAHHFWYESDPANADEPV